MGLLDFIFKLKTKKLKSYLERDAVLLDVRNDDEYQKASIKNSVHIPLHRLKDESEQLVIMGKPVIVFCARGGRAAKAVHYLRLKNLDAINGGGIKYLDKLL